MPNKDLTITVVGLGYVGLPLAVAFGRHKIKTIGFDINREKIDELKRGDDRNEELTKKDLVWPGLTYSNDPTRIKGANFIIVAVPTPVTKAKIPDLTPVIAASKIVGQNLTAGATIVYESTVYPGVTEEICRPTLEQESGLKAGRDFFIGYSPERINPGDRQHRLETIPKVVSGMDKKTLDRIAEVYSLVVKAGVYKASSIKVAEAAKVIENIQRDLNIALVNELSIIFHKLGIPTKDVLEAAATKWNWHGYSPGLVGGHCFEPTTRFVVENSGHRKLIDFQSYWQILKNRGEKILQFPHGSLIYPHNVKVMSYDIGRKKPVFAKVRAFSKRCPEQTFQIRTWLNQSITVSKKHPMAVIEQDGTIMVAHADQLLPGDRLAMITSLPEVRPPSAIDLIKHLTPEIIEKTRVRPINDRWQNIQSRLHVSKRDWPRLFNWFGGNYLPLKVYLEWEKLGKPVFPRDQICLVAGRGPTARSIKAVIPVDQTFARLIGYYVTEGCITYDKSGRVRFSINRSEVELKQDIIHGIQSFGLNYSISEDKSWQTTHIKVSFNIFAHLIDKVLDCGKGSYDAQLPEWTVYGPKDLRLATLQAIFRGDGGISVFSGRRTYQKDDRRYTHQFNSAQVTYFSSSPKLFQQVLTMLLSFQILPTIDTRRKTLIEIHGPENLRQMIGWFLDGKKRKLNNYFAHQKKFLPTKHVKRFNSYAAVQIRSIEPGPTTKLYSIEVENTQAFVNDQGILTHNCIGVDPYYLTYRAEELGYHPQIILAGRRVNDSLPEFIGHLVIKGLIETTKIIEQSTVLILGVTFKENVKDTRNSKVADLVEFLKAHRIEVTGYDPVVGPSIVKSEFGVPAVESLGEIAKPFDAIVYAVNHQQFESLNLKRLKQLTDGKPVLIDIKMRFDKKQAEQFGFWYESL